MENETRGRGPIEPVTYKNDMVFQFWVDSRLLASVTKWMESQGYYPRALSEVVREAIMIVVNNLPDEDRVFDTAEARAMLQQRFKVNLNPGGKAGKNAVHNLTLNNREIRALAQARAYDRGGPRWVPIPEYPHLMYIEGDEEMKTKLIKQYEASLTMAKSD